MEYIKENLKKFSLALTPATESDPPPNKNPHQIPPIASPQSFSTAITPYSPTIYHHRRRRSSEFADAVGFSRGPRPTISSVESDIGSDIRHSNAKNGHKRSVSESSCSENSEKSTPRVQIRHNNIATITTVGHINPSFLPSTSNIRDSGSTIDINTHNKVYREQYWTWSCKCQSWTKCEKILLLVIAVLFCIVCALITFIAIFAEEIHQMKEDGEGGFSNGIGGILNFRLT